MNTDSLIGRLEELRPSRQSPEYSEHAYRQAIDDAIAIVKEFMGAAAWPGPSVSASADAPTTREDVEPAAPATMGDVPHRKDGVESCSKNSPAQSSDARFHIFHDEAGSTAKIGGAAIREHTSNAPGAECLCPRKPGGIIPVTFKGRTPYCCTCKGEVVQRNYWPKRDPSKQQFGSQLKNCRCVPVCACKEAAPSEIRVVDDTAILHLIIDELQTAHTESDYSYHSGADELLARIRPYLRTSEPVSVDLRAGALAIRDFQETVGYDALRMAEACAQAWGLKYVK